jgi:serine/threonine protein kinase
LQACGPSLARLQAPSIVGIQACERNPEGLLCVISPFVTGLSLRENFARQPGQRLTGALQIARDLSGLLARAHAAGIAHFALRPSQVLISTAQADSGKAHRQLERKTGQGRVKVFFLPVEKP